MGDAGEVGFCDGRRCLREFCLWQARRVSVRVFDSNAGAITDHSQSAKDIDPYFKSAYISRDSADDDRSDDAGYRSGGIRYSEYLTRISTTVTRSFALKRK